MYNQYQQQPGGAPPGQNPPPGGFQQPGGAPPPQGQGPPGYGQPGAGAPPPAGGMGQPNMGPPGAMAGPPGAIAGPPGYSQPQTQPQTGIGMGMPPPPAQGQASFGGPPGGMAGPPGPPGPGSMPTSGMGMGMAPPAAQAQGQAQFSAPPNGGGMNMGMAGPPGAGGMAGPPGAAPPGGPGGAPPNSGGGPGKPVTQFYSMGGGGAPQPVQAAPGGPPQMGMGGPPQMGMGAGGGAISAPGMPPPPTGAGGPPISGQGPPGSNAGPPTGMPGPPGPGGVGAHGHVQQQQPPPYAGHNYGAPPPNSMQGMPDAFGGGGGYAPPGAAGAGQHGMPGVPGMPGQGVPQGGGLVQEPANGGIPLPSLDEMDLSIQCDPRFLRSSVGRIINTQGAANAAKIPLGVVVSPMSGDVGVDNEDVEVVDFGSTGIVRCKRCRTYINPFATWTDGGRRWRCNICGMLNDVPSSYFSQIDANGQRRDKMKRPELSKCSVEFVAPGDYMVRPPQPPVYFFVIDVSAISVASGMLTEACAAIKESLDHLAKCPRTQVGFITFDSTIHFYNLKSTLQSPQMLVVNADAEVIVPHVTDDLLVSLEDSRAVVDTLLDLIPSMFASSQITSTCTGPALQAAKRVISHLGGKLSLFQSSLPSIGEGALKPRENPRMMGTEKEHMLLFAENNWYKDNAIDFSRLQISVDLFLFSGQFTDVSTLGQLPKLTGGTCYYYPAYQTAKDGEKFHKELLHNLTRPTGFEAVMRVRATRGIRISNFYGNHYIRGQDLLALPNCTSDSCFALDFTYDEQVLAASAITVQAALLYTSSQGERRIRVHTMVIPVTQSVPEMLNSLDIDCAVNIMSKQAVDIAQKTGMETARRRVHENTADIIRAAKQGASQMGPIPGQYGTPQPAPTAAAGELPSTLNFLPLYSMSLIKNVVLRGGSDIRLDERAFFHTLVQNMNVDETIVFIYPRMFGIHDMDDSAGRLCDNADEDVKTAGPFKVRLPGTCNLTSENLTSDGIFLLETGSDLFLWVGSAASPMIMQSLFGVQTLQGADMSTVQHLTDSDDFSARFNAIITALRADRQYRYMHLHFIREGDGYAEAFFGRFLVEDRTNFPGGTHTYMEYHALVSR